MSYVVEPLFAEWARFSDSRLSQTMLGHMGLNKASWEGLQQEQTAASEEAGPSATDAENAVAGGSSSKEIPQGSLESWHSLCAASPPDPWPQHQSFPTEPQVERATLLPHPPFFSFRFCICLPSRWTTDFYLIYLIFISPFRHRAIHRYLICLLLYFICSVYLFVHNRIGITGWKHHFIFCFVNFKGKAVYRANKTFFMVFFEVPFTKQKKQFWRITETTGVLRDETPLRLLIHAMLHLYWRFFLVFKKKKVTSPVLLLPLWRLFTHLCLLNSFFKLRWILSAPRSAFEAQMWRTTCLNCHPTAEAMSRTWF